MSKESGAPFNNPPSLELPSEESIWQQVAAFRESGIITIPGMTDTPADWLHEFSKHQHLLQYANTIRRDQAPTTGIMTQGELDIMETMRAANPSDEDAIWGALPPSKS